MRLQGGINLNQDGLSQSIRAMHLASEIFGIASENITGFDKVGYQRKEPVVSSFAETIGIHALSKAVDDQIGRIMASKNPLDFALNNKGYFQIQQQDGSIDLTRDGRFQVNEKGELVSLGGLSVLDEAGLKIKLPFFPDKLTDINVTSDGKMTILNRNTNKMDYVANIGVVSADGAIVVNKDVKQGYTEGSNINLQQEFMELVPWRRNFDANRQLFVLQSTNLSKAIQELGRGS